MKQKRSQPEKSEMKDFYPNKADYDQCNWKAGRDRITLLFNYYADKRIVTLAGTSTEVPDERVAEIIKSDREGIGILIPSKYYNH